ncbi:importin subunit alpha-2 [Trifolium repens]|nr:importin subunit alpha-2 [Trifolium repens]
MFNIFCIQIQSEKDLKILKVRSNHGGEFENEPFATFCEDHGIIHEFSAPRTHQQNGVVERKNRSLQEMARTMMHETRLSKYFWVEAVNTRQQLSFGSCFQLIERSPPIEEVIQAGVVPRFIEFLKGKTFHNFK